MELLRIGEEKLKIILTHEDLLSFEMSETDLDYTNTETKRMLWEILHRAKSSVGFNADGHRVLVQLYPTRESGCELFVTRLGALPCDCLPDAQEETKEEEPLHSVSPKKSPSGSCGRLGAFCFESLGDLLTVCRRLSAIPHRSQSYAYRSEDGRYHLFLDGLDTIPYLSVDEFSFLHEYGTAEPVTATQTMLSERGLLFCPSDAVKTLGVL